MNTQNEYDAFAMDYHWLYSDKVLSGERFLEGHDEILKAQPPLAAILDCACGIGVHSLALARRGFHVQGTDLSTGMVAEAQRRAANEHLGVAFTACAWSDLSRKVDQRFNVVFRTGNALGHCQSTRERLAALSNKRAVLRPGGLLVLDSLNWEKVRRERVRFHSVPMRVRNGRRCLPLYVWNYPRRWQDAHVIELVLLFPSDQGTEFRRYPITYYPFRHEELLRCLKIAGFQKLTSDFDQAKDSYVVAAMDG
jgi:glycine/sarcosine N-methyltransferase